jgi:HAD superfamily hydrolase (TIGR01509 family)
MRRIAAVTFDLWDTLIQEAPGNSGKVAELRVSRMWRFLGDKGLAHTRHEVAEAYRESADFLAMTWSKRRDMPVRDQVLFMLTSIDSKLTGRLSQEDLSRIEKEYSEGLLDHPPMLLPGAKEALKDVRSKGYRVGLISNTGRTPGTTLRVLMDRMGILGYFDTTTFSNEILIRKPALGAFTVTLDKLKVVPKAAVHVGNDAESDIAGAKRAGMKALHIVADGTKPSPSADNHTRSLDQVLALIEKL